MPRSGRILRNPPVEEPEFDATKFVGLTAQKYFEKHARRNWNVENEFNFEGLGFDAIVQRYGWTHLAVRPANKGSKILVREFYANAKELSPERTLSKVRGKDVWFDPDTINTYYNMPTHGTVKSSCDYYRQAQIMERDLENNLHLLAPTFVDIDLNYMGGGFVKPTSELSLEMNALHRFICDRILPSTHYGDVHWKRALIMNVVLTGQIFNTGLAMSLEIQSTCRNMGRSNVNFPLLISGLIDMARVSFTRPRIERDIESLGTAVSKKTIKEKGHAKAGEGSSRGRRGRTLVEEMEEHAFTDTEAAYYVAGHVDALGEEIRDLRKDHTQLTYHVNEELYAGSMWRDRMEDMITNEFEENRAYRQMMTERFSPYPPPPQSPFLYGSEQQNPEVQMDWQSWNEQMPPQQHGSSSSSSQSGPWDHIFCPPSQ